MQRSLRTAVGRVPALIALLLLILAVSATAHTANASPGDSNGTRQSMAGVLTMVGGFQTSHNPAPTADFPYGVYTISGTGENISGLTVSDIEVEVTSLTGGNAVLECAGGVPMGVGCTVVVANSALGADGVLSPGEQFNLTVNVGLASPLPFSLGFSTYGVIVDEDEDPDPTPQVPEQLQLELETGNEASEVIDETGGVVTAVANDGTVITLTIPEDALVEPTEITITPVSSIANGPFEDDIFGGVRFEPEGLQFNGFATLEIEFAGTTTLPGAVGFGFKADGTEFHLYPSDIDGNTATFLVPHFSGVGLAAATPAEVQALLDQHTPTTAEQQALQAIAAVGALATPGEFAEVAEDALRQWYLDEVLPATFDATLSDGDLASAVNIFSSWVTWVFRYATTEFPAEIAGSESLLTDGFIAAIDRANSRCNTDRDINAAGAALVWQQAAVQIGLANEGPLETDAVLDNLCVQAEITEMTVTPDPIPAGETAELDMVASFSFSDGTPVFDPPMNITFDTGTFGSVSPNTGVTDETGHFTGSVSLNGERLVARNAQACISTLPVVCTSADLDVAGELALDAIGYLESETFEDGRTQVASVDGEAVIIEVTLLEGETSALNGQTVNFSLNGLGSLSDTEDTVFDGRSSVTFTPPSTGIGASFITTSFTTPVGEVLSAQVLVGYTTKTIVVSETAITLRPSGEIQLFASVFGVTPDTVIWSASGGTIDSTGLYTAPEDPGTYTVTATSTGDPGLTAQVQVEVAINFSGGYLGTIIETIHTENGSSTFRPSTLQVNIIDRDSGITGRWEHLGNCDLSVVGTVEGDTITLQGVEWLGSCHISVQPNRLPPEIEITATLDGDTLTGTGIESQFIPNSGIFFTYEFTATR